ncbi:MAG: dethiobiotin synthase [Bacteroidota bacterium]
MHYFVTGIDTGSGKTLASAILCEALEADYWKPIQSGLPRDTDTVAALISNKKTQLFSERFLLKKPASPHDAAQDEGIAIHLSDFSLPPSNNLIIEGAGGCLVPINNDEFVIDIAGCFQARIVLVADLYLGSINHTLLTANLLRQKRAHVVGIIFNGPTNPASEEIILRHTGYRRLLHIDREAAISKETVKRYADQLKKDWHE